MIIRPSGVDAVRLKDTVGPYGIPCLEARTAPPLKKPAPQIAIGTG